MRALPLLIVMSSVDAWAKPFHQEYDADYDWMPQHSEPVPILEQHYESMDDGSYRWNFQGADGTSQWSEGAPAWSGPGHAVRGEYAYDAPDGPVAVSYVADEHGFQPTGNHIHPDIMRAVALQVAKAKEEPEGMWDDRGFLAPGFQHYLHY